MNRNCGLLVIILLLCTSCSAMLITEFCPDPYLADDADEYLVLSGSGSLEGITISDGEGGFRFPPGSTISGRRVIARNSVAFNRTHGYLPDFEWFDYSKKVPDVISGDKLRMANARDELVLYDRGTLVQKVAWPSDVKPREGQIHYLESGVWDRRLLFIGQSRFSPATFGNVTVTAFVSPDSSGEVFVSALRSAGTRVNINVYEFTSTAIAGELVRARQRGADVQVLVEGGPVGGISPEEKNVVRLMREGGIAVFMMASSGDMKAPYRFDHAKYAVIDNRAVIVTSENFKASGIPPGGRKGNRGWGVYLEDPALSAYFNDIFETDMKSTSTVPFYGTPGPNETPSLESYADEFMPARFSNARVTPVISPDTSSLITRLIEGAQQTIEIEQAYITNETAVTLNPFLAAAINASRRGVKVRVLLDSYWYNVEDEKDNDEMAALINRIAATENLPLEARCADLSFSNLEKIHNKGVIIDNKSVLVSSINWNSNSPNFNREAGVIIDHEGVAQYFRGVFDDDWQPRVPRHEPVQDPLKIILLALVIIILFVIYVRYTRRR